ncbi:MAG: 3' terminal RNA ribose 2'-O-methyltransferase Hen1 [Gammaproteobacteria bacterium]|nr:3' terminal RNA ribose 2'-O-methyltransferase Hen1 [Gammaproteobacteria bacterium]MDE0443529.1 3' terminal RNA ribose 2'-O-methyltransferase Hen1 [Gammaproteobacteria bacterium]
MLLTISTTHSPATDLGYLLHKNPARVQAFDLSFGKAHVFYPQASEECCTAALLLDVDPVALVRGRGSMTTDYVNDRPYVASSFLSVAIARVFGSALGGRCRDRPELVAKPLPLVAGIAALPCRSADEVRELFEPLGYEVDLEPGDDASESYRNVTLSGRKPLAEVLTHLYVLVPVLDGRKHYWVGDAEVDKLIARGEGWLEDHPRRDLIVRRYLKHRDNLANDALARLAEDADAGSPDGDDRPGREAFVALSDVRVAAVARALKESNATRIIDLGCGEGRLIEQLLADPQFQEVVGVDVSVRALETASRRLRLDRMPERQRRRVKLLQGTMTYRDRRIEGFDALAVVEALEHLEPERLGTFERVLFEFAKPETVVVTTPNREYNVKYPGIPAGGLRHPDHRFEWTRSEFAAWADTVAARHGYSVALESVGDVDGALGAPTQMGRFRRCA